MLYSVNEKLLKKGAVMKNVILLCFLLTTFEVFSMDSTIVHPVKTDTNEATWLVASQVYQLRDVNPYYDQMRVQLMPANDKLCNLSSHHYEAIASLVDTGYTRAEDYDALKGVCRIKYVTVSASVLGVQAGSVMVNVSAKHIAYGRVFTGLGWQGCNAGLNAQKYYGGDYFYLRVNLYCLSGAPSSSYVSSQGEAS